MRTRRPLSLPSAHSTKAKPIPLVSGGDDIIEKVPLAQPRHSTGYLARRLRLGLVDYV